MTHATRPRPASALLVLALLLGLLGPGAVMAQPGAGRAGHQGVAASPLHAVQLVLPDRSAGLLTAAERGQRHGSAWPGASAAALVAALVAAGLGSRSRVWRSLGGAGQRGRPRRTRSRAPPSPPPVHITVLPRPSGAGRKLEVLGCLVILDGACSASWRC